MTANNVGHFEMGVASELIGARNALIIGGMISMLVVILIYIGFRGVSNYKLED
jgi:hypothetical protein